MAAPFPKLDLDIWAITRLSLPYSSTTSVVPSVEPSSTMMISFGQVHRLDSAQNPRDMFDFVKARYDNREFHAGLRDILSGGLLSCFNTIEPRFLLNRATYRENAFAAEWSQTSKPASIRVLSRSARSMS